MKLSHGILLTIVCLLVNGCVSVSIQSNVKADARPVFRRILVVSRLSTVSPTYLPKFQTAFPAGYQVCTVSTSPISFETADEAIQKQVQACSSDVILTLDFNRNFTSGGGKYISSYNELYMEMTNVATGKPFWKAIVTTGGDNEVPPRQIINQLQKDGVLEGVLPEAD
jgi:hypothetical protein